MLSPWYVYALAAWMVLWWPGAAFAALQRRITGAAPDGWLQLGLSVALTPLTLLWADVLGLPLTRGVLLALYGACAGLWLSLTLAEGRAALRRFIPPREARAACAGLCVILTATLALRLLQARALALPAWVDSLHHTQIVQTLLATGALPRTIPSYQPIPFYYYFGFHSLAAAFCSLTRLPAPQGVLLFGQILNALIGAALYRLALALTGERRWGIAAAALVGFVSQMPAYYLSWGRYTFLAAWLLTPLLMAAAWEALTAPRQRPAVVVVCAGLLLTHYIAAAYYAAFVVVVLWQHRRARPPLRGWLLMHCMGLALTLPWLWRIAPLVAPAARVQPAVPAQLAQSAEKFQEQLRYLRTLINRPRDGVLAALALLGLCAQRRRRGVQALGGWLAALAALSNQWLVRIGPLRVDLLVISGFAPLSILAAGGLTALWRWIMHFTEGKLGRPLWTLSLLALSAWGARETLSIVNPVTVLATAEDLPALAWVQANTPPDARFFINVTFWQYNMYRGVDGGWWLPLVAARETTLPPGVLYGWGERAYIEKIKAIAERAQAVRACDATFWEFVAQERLTHIYLGGTPGTLTPEALQGCASVTEIYHTQRVHIYQIASGNSNFIPATTPAQSATPPDQSLTTRR